MAVFEKHYAENPILDPTRISMLGHSDGFGVRDNNGTPTHHSMYEGVINTYYVFRRMGQTAWVEVSPNNQDSVYGEPNKNKIYKRYKLQRIIDDVNMKRERDEYDMTAKLFKYCNLEEIPNRRYTMFKEIDSKAINKKDFQKVVLKQLIEELKKKNEKPKKEEKITKPKKNTKRLVKTQKKICN